MAGKSSFGGTVKLTGETEYQRALKSITANLTVLSSEMKVVSSSFNKNENSINSLNQKNDILKKKLVEQNKALEEAKKILDEAKNSTDANSITVKKWQNELNKAQVEINKTTREISNNEDILNKLKDANVDNTNELKNFEKAEDKVGQSAIKMGDLIKANIISDSIMSGLKSLGSVLMDATREMMSFISDGIENASNLQEVQNVVDTTFGNSSSKIDEWSKKAATSYGMSELSAKKYNGTMGAMLKSMGLTDDAVLQMSTDMVGLSGDFASFYNLDSEEAFNKIRAGISGETEPLKQLGINMSVANLEAYALSQGIEKSYNSMTQAEQATLRYNYLMNVSADAQGDFTKTSDSFANQQRIAQLQMENFATSIGSFLLPSLNNGLKAINSMMDGSLSLKDGFSQLTDIVMGLGNKILENLPELTETAILIIKQLATGIQESLPELIPIAIEIINTLITSILEMLPQILEMGIQLIVELANGLAQSLPTLIPVVIDSILTIVDTLLNNINQLVDAGIQLILGLADGLINALPQLLEKIPVIIDKLLVAITDNLPKLLQMGITLLIKLVEGIVKSIPSLIAIAPKVMMSLLGALGNYLGNMLSMGSDLINKVKDGLSNGIQGIKNVGKNIVEGLWNGIKDMKDWVIKKIKGFGNDVLDGLKNFFGIHSPSTVMRDQVGKFLAQGIGVGFENEMSSVNKEIQKSLPTDFDLSTDINLNKNLTNGLNSESSNSNLLVTSFKQALSEMQIILDDEVAGNFVENKIERVIYS